MNCWADFKTLMKLFGVSVHAPAQLLVHSMYLPNLFPMDRMWDEINFKQYLTEYNSEVSTIQTDCLTKLRFGLLFF